MKEGKCVGTYKGVLDYFEKATILIFSSLDSDI